MGFKNQIILVHRFKFNYPFEKLFPIIRNIQTIGNLMNFIQSKILSEPIILKGETTFEKDTWFFFRYKKFINIYMKIDEVIETDYFLKIDYNIYKTSPKFMEFHFVVTLNHINDNESNLIIESIFPKFEMNKFVIQTCRKDTMNNFLILNKSIEMNNQNTFYNSGIVFRNNYEFVKNICCHYKTFKVFFPNIKSIEKINNDYEEEDNGIFNEEQDFLIKLKSNNKYNFPSELKFKVCKTQLLKTQSIISFLITNMNDNYVGKKKEILNYYLTFFIRKITQDKTFFSIKSTFEYPIQQDTFKNCMSFSNKIVDNLKSICLIYENSFN